MNNLFSARNTIYHFNNPSARQEVKTLFERIPNLKSFYIETIAGAHYLCEVNDVALPSIFTPEENYASWFNLVELSVDEVKIISAAISEFYPQLDNKRFFMREEFLNLSVDEILEAHQNSKQRIKNIFSTYGGLVITNNSFCSTMKAPIVKALFQEIPQLESFNAHELFDTPVFVEVNNQSCPVIKFDALTSFELDSIKAWLVDINLKEKDILLMIKVIMFLRVWKDQRTYTRALALYNEWENS